MTQLRSLLATFLSITFAVPLPRGAADPGVALTDADKQATARRYVDAGLAAQGAKDYAAAVDFYLRAYDLVPHPLLIYNMAEVHRLAGHHAEALAHYQRYLAADPAGARAADATRQLEPLRRAVEAEAARAAAAAKAKAEAERREAEAREAEDRRLADLARRAQEERQAEQRRREEVERALRVAAARASARRKGDRLKLAGLGLGTAGLTGLGLGLYFGRRASDRAAEVSAVYDEARFADGQDAERAQLITLSAGGALTVAGATLLILGWRAGRATPLVVTPTAAADGAAITVGGAW